MNKESKPRTIQSNGVYNAPWEKNFDRILKPFEEFIHRQAASSLLSAGVIGYVWLYLASKPTTSQTK